MDKEINYLEGIKLVSFDIWSTLLTTNPVYKDERAKAISTSLCKKDISLEQMHKIIKEADDALDRQTEIDGKQYGLKERLYAIYDLLDSSIRVAEMNDDVVKKFDDISLELVSTYLPIVIEEDLLETLKKLQERGVEMAVMSNTGFIEGKHMRVALEKLGILPFMRVQLFSNEVGVAKPDKQIFDAIVDQTGYLPSEILHVGDNLIADYVGATKADLKAVWLTKKEENPETPKIAKIGDLVKI